MADEQNLIDKKLYYDMLDEASSIDGVLHDLIGTLKEEDLNKAIFVTKEYIDQNESVEVKFHLTAKDMKQTINNLVGGGDEDEILLGAENNKIKGSGAYVKRNNDRLNEIFNSNIIMFDGNRSYVIFDPVQFTFNFKQETDEEGNLVNPSTRSSFTINPGVFATSGISNSGSFSSVINYNSVIINNTEEKRLEIDPLHIYFRGGGNPWDSSANSNTIDMIGKSKFFMSNYVYPFNSSTTGPNLSNNPYNFNTYVKEGDIGAQLLIDDCGAAFIRGKAILYLDSADPEAGKLPSYYNVFYTRHGSYLSQSSTNGPVIAAQGNPFVYFSGSPIFNVRNNARVMIDGNSRLTMHGRPRVDITGQDYGNLGLSTDFIVNSEGDFGGTSSPEILIHDKVRINIDNGRNSNGTYNYTGYSRTNYNNGAATVYIHDKATIDMSKGCWLKMSDTALIEGTGTSTFMMHDNGYLEIAGDAVMAVHGQASFLIDDNSMFKMSNIGNLSSVSPLFMMDGATCFKMQSSNNSYGPLFIAQETGLIFIGNGMSQHRQGRTSWSERFNGSIGTENSIGTRLSNLVDRPNIWGDIVKVQNYPYGPLCPALKVGGYVTLNIENESPGGVYVQIGNPSSSNYGINVFLQGDTYIKTGEHNHIELLGGWLQTTGNPHTEIHDNTHFVYRGNLKVGAPWLDGFQWTRLTRLEDGELGWKNFNSARCVQPTNSPITQLYDTSNFCMRGKWRVKEFQKTKYSIDIIKSDNLALYNELKNKQDETDITEFSLELENYIRDQINNTILSGKAYSFNEIIDDETVTTSLKNEDVEELLSIDSIKSVTITTTKITLNSIKYTVKPIKPKNWTDRAIKAENNPVLEIIENADVRVSGDVVFNIDNSGVTIGNDEKTINFTFEQLEQLKELLS